MRSFVPLLLSVGIAGLTAAPAIATPTWSTPQTVEWLHEPTLVDELRGSLRVAADAQGNEVAAWLDAAPDGRWAVTVSSRPARGGWLPATRFFIRPKQILDDLTLRLDVSATGWAVVSWTESTGTDGAPQSRFVTRTPAGVWAQPATSEPPQPAGSTGTEYHSIDIGPAGELSVTWLRQEAGATPDSPSIPVLGRRLRPAGATSFLTDSLTADSTSQPQFDAAGNALVLDRVADGGLVARQRTSSGPWQAPVRLAPAASPSTGLDEIGPTVRWSMAPDGSIAAIWLRGRGGQVDVQAIRRSAAGAWGAVTSLGQISEATPTFLGGLSVAAGPAGAVAAWSTFSLQAGGGSESRVLGAVAGPTGGWSAARPLAPTIVNGGPDEFDGYAALHTAVGGTVGLATWSTSAGAAGGAQFVAGQRDWSAPFSLPNSVKATNLGATISPSDRASVLWGEGERLRWSAAQLGPQTPTPTPVPVPTRSVSIDAALTAANGLRCPARVQIAVNGTAAGSLAVAGAGLQRCRATGTIPVSASLRPGTAVLVTLTGSGLIPTIVVVRAR